MFITNNHIYLRAIESNDLELLYACENNTAIWHISNAVAPFSKDVLQQYIDTAHVDIYSTKQLRLMICLNDTHECAGTIDLFDFEPMHQRIGIGILIFENYRNKNIAFDSIGLVKNYCFNQLLVNQLYCNISASNEASIKLFEKCDFKQIGLKKQWNRISQFNYEDEWLYQCLLSEV